MPESVRVFDLAIVQTLADSRSEPLVSFFSVLSALGDTEAMIIATLVGVTLLYSQGHKPLAVGLLTAMISSTFLTVLLKFSIAEARPDALYSVYVESTYSFPSGHTSAAFAFFGFLAYIALTRERHGTLRNFVIALAILYPVLMAFGRVYLGLHYVSDVIAGCAIGLLSAAIGVIVAQKLGSQKFRK